MSIQSNIDTIENELNSWYPCNMLRRTKWIYRVDALRNHDMRGMHILWEVVELLKVMQHNLSFRVMLLS